MTLRIRPIGDPVLRKTSDIIEVIDQKLMELANDMVSTMRKYNGVGLAAPQIGVNLRLIVIETPLESCNNNSDANWEETQLLKLINPSIIEANSFEEMREGCLSLPGFITNVERANAVTARATDMSGTQIQIPATGLLAQALQHEIDHLDGILIQDRIDGIVNMTKLDPPWLTNKTSEIPERR